MAGRGATAHLTVDVVALPTFGLTEVADAGVWAPCAVLVGAALVHPMRAARSPSRYVDVIAGSIRASDSLPPSDD
jgi:hypothetical protein